MTHTTTISSIPPWPSIETAWQDVYISFERFCLSAGIESPLTEKHVQYVTIIGAGAMAHFSVADIAAANAE